MILMCFLMLTKLIKQKLYMGNAKRCIRNKYQVIGSNIFPYRGVWFLVFIVLSTCDFKIISVVVDLTMNSKVYYK